MSMPAWTSTPPRPPTAPTRAGPIRASASTRRGRISGIAETGDLKRSTGAHALLERARRLDRRTDSSDAGREGRGEGCGDEGGADETGDAEADVAPAEVGFASERAVEVDGEGGAKAPRAGEDAEGREADFGGHVGLLGAWESRGSRRA